MMQTAPNLRCGRTDRHQRGAVGLCSYCLRVAWGVYRQRTLASFRAPHTDLQNAQGLAGSGGDWSAPITARPKYRCLAAHDPMPWRRGQVASPVRVRVLLWRESRPRGEPFLQRGDVVLANPDRAGRPRRASGRAAARRRQVPAGQAGIQLPGEADQLRRAVGLTGRRCPRNLAAQHGPRARTPSRPA